MTTFGFTISQRASLIGGGQLSDLLAMGVDIDRSGLFDTVWVGDSLTTKPRPDALACLSALAATTQTVRLGVACMATFPVRDPLQFALQWSTLDQISQGRTILSVCNGIQKAGGKSAQEGEFFGGIPDSERAPRLEEYVELCRLLWSGEQIDFDGRFVQYRDLQISPTVQQAVPIWLAGSPAIGTPLGDRFFDRVARLADGYVMTTKSVARVEESRRHLEPALDRHGKTLADLPIGAYTGIGIGNDRPKLLEDAAEFFGRYYGPGVFTADTVGDYAGVFGSVQQVVDELLLLVEAGVDHVTLRLPSFAPREQLELLITEVIPAVQAGSRSVAAR